MGCSILPWASTVSSLGGLMFGYELAIISGALLQLKLEFRLSCVQQEALVSSLLIGALLASTVGGLFIDRHGRRNAILLSNIMILTGSLMLLISSYPVLVVGRITVGFAMCISSMSCCIFVSEMVPPIRRGFLVTLYEAGITVGILAAYAINYFLSDWRCMFGLAVVPTLAQLVSIWFLPPSTKHSSSFCHTEKDLISYTETPEAENSKVQSSKYTKRVCYGSRSLFQHEDNMRSRTIIGLGLVLFQQFTGQPNLLFYASTIFHSVGFQSNASALLASVGLGFVKVIATLASMVFSDRLGRRPLLISGCSVMALSLLTIGLLSGPSLINVPKPCDYKEFRINTTDLPQLADGHRSVVDLPLHESHGLPKNNTQDENVLFDESEQKPLEPAAESGSTVVNWIILLCMMAVVSAYSIGFGPMTWVLLSEIFPAAVRGRAFAFTSCFNWAANLLVTCTFLNVVDTIGLSKVFLLYGLTAVAAGVFFYFLLPETKGKTLEEIDWELRLNRFQHSEQCCGCIGHRATSTQYQRVHCQMSTSGSPGNDEDKFGVRGLPTQDSVSVLSPGCPHYVYHPVTERMPVKEIIGPSRPERTITEYVVEIDRQRRLLGAEQRQHQPSTRPALDWPTGLAQDIQPPIINAKILDSPESPPIKEEQGMCGLVNKGNRMELNSQGSSFLLSLSRPRTMKTILGLQSTKIIYLSRQQSEPMKRTMEDQNQPLTWTKLFFFF